MAEQELDVRGLPKPDKHPAIFAAYEHLPIGAAFVLVNNHDPKHLREEFESDYPGSYGWEYVEKGPRVWRIRISKLAATAPCGYGTSLEWATSCPPPRRNFTELPRIRSERPAFELHYPCRMRAESHLGRRPQAAAVTQTTPSNG